ncbi:MAG TPA: hypothetical protein VGL56_14585 [Fimbriimonadaceae bacterium]|jgi:hypothetical protein
MSTVITIGMWASYIPVITSAYRLHQIWVVLLTVFGFPIAAFGGYWLPYLPAIIRGAQNETSI